MSEVRLEQWLMQHPEYAKARHAMERASERRRALPPGSSRSKVTTANANWSTKAEALERTRKLLLLCLERDARNFGAMLHAAQRPEIEGCGDNSCECRSPGGMATNGGCRCDDRRKRAALLAWRGYAMDLEARMTFATAAVFEATEEAGR